MEFVAKPIALKHETKELLDEICASSEPTAAYALRPDEAEELFKHITEPMLRGCPLPITVINQMRWYVCELSAKFRTRYGYALAFQLELVLRKWAAFGMEPNTMQYLLREVYRQLGLIEQEADHEDTRDKRSRGEEEESQHKGTKDTKG